MKRRSDGPSQPVLKPFGNGAQNRQPLANGGESVSYSVASRYVVSRTELAAKNHGRQVVAKAMGSRIPVSGLRTRSLPADSPKKPAAFIPVRTKSYPIARPVEISNAEPPEADLQAVVDGWHALPDAVRRGIVAMVRAASPTEFEPTPCRRVPKPRK
jgi:hypothetical protein